jgi:hypothetical protein
MTAAVVVPYQANKWSLVVCTRRQVSIILLSRSGNFKILIYLCDPFASHSKQRLLSQIVLTG